MRDPNRIDPIIAALTVVWKANPDLRLGQLIVNAADTPDPFYIEDDKLLDGIEGLSWASHYAKADGE